MDQGIIRGSNGDCSSRRRSSSRRGLKIFESARTAGVVVMTKDGDFAELVNRLGPPPHVIWVRVGNTSQAEMKKILAANLADVLSLVRRGEPLVEISSR